VLRHAPSTRTIHFIHFAATAAFVAGHIVTVAAGDQDSNACNFSPAAAGGKGRVITVMATDKGLKPRTSPLIKWWMIVTSTCGRGQFSAATAAACL
jgi:hypothetical protein